MFTTIRFPRTAALAVTLAGTLICIPQVSLARSANPPVQDQNDAASAAANKLDKKQFKDVKVTVDNGIATLSGSVPLYEYKVDADKRIHKVRGVTAVRNEIEVAGPNVPDQELKSKLLEKLTYDRVGYGNAFNSISLDVHNGVV